MNRRSLLRAVPATAGLSGLAALAGCAALYGPVRFGSGQSHLHPASDPFVRGGLDAESDDDFRAWLFTDAPETDPIRDAADEQSVTALRDDVVNESYEGVFRLLVEAQMPYEERFHLAPDFFEDPEWVRLADVTVPLERDDATDVELDFESETVVATSLWTFEARTMPRGVTVAVYPEYRDGGPTDRRPLTRFDAR